MVDTHGAGHASARGLAGVALAQDAPVADQKTPEMGKAVGDFVSCLKDDKCPSHSVPGAGCQLGEAQTKANKTSLLAETHCVSGDQPCTQGCAAKALGSPDAKAPAFVQKN